MKEKDEKLKENSGIPEEIGRMEKDNVQSEKKRERDSCAGIDN